MEMPVFFIGTPLLTSCREVPLLREQFRMIWRELSRENRNQISCANRVPRVSLFVKLWSVGESQESRALNKTLECVEH